jgi:hypothetical protein
MPDLPDWICGECGIEAKDHGHKCGARISAIIKPKNPDPTPTEKQALICLCHMIRDAARKAKESILANDEEEFDRLIGLLNLPGDRLLEAVLREVNR